MKASAAEANSGSRLESAVAWLVRLEAVGEAQLTPEELQAWEDWAADEANRAVFDELAALRQQLKAVPAVARPTRAELIADRVSDADVGSEHRRSHWPLAVAASALLAVASLITLRLLNSSPSPVPQIRAASYATRTGEQRRLELPDGSTIMMGGSSLLSVNYTARQRSVTLDRGEALFHVTHNPVRPFHVYAGNGVITDVGTQFNVLRAAQRVTVTVTEGAVEIAPARLLKAVRPQDISRLAAPKWLPVRVTHGEEMSYQSQGEATAVERVDPRLAVAWVRGTLVYDRRPLSQVIDDVTRYWGHQVTLGPGAGELLYSGTVGERHIGAWIHGLPAIFPVNVTETNDGKVAIQLRGH